MKHTAYFLQGRSSPTLAWIGMAWKEWWDQSGVPRLQSFWLGGSGVRPEICLTTVQEMLMQLVWGLALKHNSSRIFEKLASVKRSRLWPLYTSLPWIGNTQGLLFLSETAVGGKDASGKNPESFSCSQMHKSSLTKKSRIHPLTEFCLPLPGLPNKGEWLQKITLHWWTSFSGD